jgi:hypothetical protein
MIFFLFRQDPPGEEQDCVKLYSDPDMFFMIWKKSMLEEVTR